MKPVPYDATPEEVAAAGARLVVFVSEAGAVGDLPAVVWPWGEGTQQVVSRWELTAEERSAVAAGGHVLVSVLTLEGSGPPPVGLQVEGLEYGPDSPDPVDAEQLEVGS